MPAVKPLLIRTTFGASHGWSFFLEGYGAMPDLTPLPFANLKIDASAVAVKKTLSPINMRSVGANDSIVQLPFRIIPPSTATDGGGVGDITITVVGGPVITPIGVGYGEPPPGYVGPPPKTHGDSKNAVTIKPVLRKYPPGAHGITVLIEGCDAIPTTSARVDLVINGVHQTPAMATSPARIFSHLTPDGYFVHVYFADPIPPNDGSGTLYLKIDGVEYPMDVYLSNP